MAASSFVFKLILCALLIVTCLSISNATGSSDSTPARVLAKQTGAAQFEEERYEAHTNCNEHKHHLKKRASDEDVDYEVYQGVVGRPGIDFPIYPRIPKTSFSCRSFGNGYFADMETDCQVFHICEDGRKISFLCPNGTIFQQSELTCDWWFKVNCLGSSGYYADSAEILNKQRVQRIRPSVPVQGFNIVGGGLNIKPRVSNQVPRSRTPQQSERRFDSNEVPSMEAADFEDISGEKQLKGEKTQIPENIDNNNNNDETQVTAESASFVDGRNRNSFGYEKPHAEPLENKSAEGRGRNNGNGRSSAYVDGRRGNANNDVDGNKNGNGNGRGKDADKRSGNRNSNGNNGNADASNDRSSQARDGYNYPKGTTERTRDSQRRAQRYRDEAKSQHSSTELRDVSTESRESNKKPSANSDKSSARQVIAIEGRSKSRNGQSSIRADSDESDELRYSTRYVESRPQITTPHQAPGTYSTARRLDTTRSTPYYTPTVPTVAKSKTTEGKGFYIKGSPVAGSNIIASTPNPNRYNSGAETTPNGGNRRRVSSQESTTPANAVITTLRPLVIGMRHSYESSAERDKDALSSSIARRKRPESANLITTTVAPATTGPTYLPRNSGRPNAIRNAGGDDFLAAPQPNNEINDAVQQNVVEMIKTINMLKNKFDDVDQSKFQGQVREGLDIPPSSGPDALVSLAKYFESEQNAAGGSAANKRTGSSVDVDVPAATPSTLEVSAQPVRASDGGAASTSTITPGVSKKADDIRASLLSERTVSQYANLFGLDTGEGRTKSESSSPPKQDNITTTVGANGKFSLFPPIGTTGATISELAAKPDSRKIAQVFSEAISSYLEDPITFRAQLAAIRPTEPPQVVSGKPNFDPVTVTDRSLFQSGTAATYLPTQEPPTTDAPATASSIAAEINNNFDFSTTSNDFLSTTDAPETTTYRPRGAEARGKNLRRKLTDEHKSPFGAADSGEHDEVLHGEHTQSFVMPRENSNTNSYSNGDGDVDGGKGKTVYTAVEQKATENPWNYISQTDFLDPLTINDGLMNEPTTTTTTSEPSNLAKKEVASQTSNPTTHGQLSSLPADTKRPTGRKIESYIRVGSAEETTRHPSSAHEASSSPEFDPWQELFHTYNLPQESLPSSNGLQRIANKLFGGLNETEALHLKNVMQQAEHNRQVLSLLLLLIQTCDDQNGRALERSRKHLLNALIDMDGKLTHEGGGKTAHNKGDKAPAAEANTSALGQRSSATSAAVVSQNSFLPTTTPRVDADTTPSQSATTNNNSPLPGSSTTIGDDATTTTTAASTVPAEETTKFQIRVEDFEESTTTSGVSVSVAGSSGNSSSNSDERALELLKSLYSLASKFASRR